MTMSDVYMDFMAKVVSQHMMGSIVNIALTYDHTKPWEVAIKIVDDPSNVWVFARDLLVAAINTGSAGIGDVRIWHDDNRYAYILLTDGKDTMTLQLALLRVRQFVKRMRTVVPYGEETMDFDEDLDKLLKGTL